MNTLLKVYSKIIYQTDTEKKPNSELHMKEIIKMAYSQEKELWNSQTEPTTMDLSWKIVSKERENYTNTTEPFYLGNGMPEDLNPEKLFTKMDSSTTDKF
jgi:hypothetical protein